ncbi:MAG TPA: PIG-L deacetylase family protein [Methylomirabilota bacterium]|jgi:LmbE family N-acetylglucosaminyl deacetylase|nr:PIG-L deacetylase family protein [Methylomirabilota bacterium]
MRLGLEPREGPLEILCLGAHADDLEIGCGGTLLKLADSGRPLAVTWVVFSAEGEREREAREGAEIFLARAKAKVVVVKSFRDGFFPPLTREIKQDFEELKREVAPDVIFTHYRNDGHQDHRLLSELTWSTFRSHLILEYEIPKYDGDLGSPNAFVDLDESLCRRKIEAILGVYRTQAERHWFTEDLFMAMLRLRGVESGATTRYAEGFYCRKALLSCSQ